MTSDGFKIAVGLSRSECEDFLINEERLLDDERFDEWLLAAGRP